MPLTFKPKRKKNRISAVMISAIALLILAAVGYWYVFIAGAPQLDTPPPEEVAGINFQVKSFYSNAMAEQRQYGVVLPPGYEKHPKRRYPVIFLLHGGHGDERDYYIKAGITATLKNLYQKKLLPAALLIMPDGNDQRGTSPFWDSDYFDGANGKVATYIAEDLVKEVKAQFRTIEDSHYWAMGGLSSGAWGAFNIGLRHLDKFTIFFSHTGYFIDKSGAENSPQLFVTQISQAERRRIRAYLDAGEGDEKYLDATRDFHKVLDRLGIYNEFCVFPGGHGIVGQDVGWNYWRKHLTDSLSFVGRQFQHIHTQKKHQHF
ncbi:alpha/beta hydrolase-fold protein [Leptolyngbya boryana CZ1]|uniref:Alpha/beta hydrolase-fold protein n=1 Tax=Leptolyngbya boryana CZ1 TaxID=3060204 RepID=A0AA97APU9_LEPBY|nr:alpha/beta hydrolase-fold protein [Leptolyngbya boryana]WNZ47033.1 alpha/beta hydrolase-fold protein [Leptolyngbya boryana CZ1]